jgi:hypothetical protein
VTISPYQSGAVAVPDQAPQVSAVAQLVEWAQGAQAAYQVAENLVNTSFCPKHYRGKPHEATAAILAGLEVGLSPMASLQAFHDIQGNAAPKAITLRAIVQSHGHHLDIVESSATKAVAVGRRNGTGAPQTSTWTIERATTMGLVSKNANWKTQPEAMLIARVTSECARMIASDAILGIPYSVEELEDGGPVQAVAEQTSPPAAGARRRNPSRIGPAAVPDPDPEPVSPAEELIDPKGSQMKALHARLRELGVTDREEALVRVSSAVGRAVSSTAELTRVEASRVLDVLSERVPLDDSDRPAS